MDLETAIEIKEEDLKRRRVEYDPNLLAADRLGIEAMKGIIAWRVDYDDNLLISLPGETEESEHE